MNVDTFQPQLIFSKSSNAQRRYLLRVIHRGSHYRAARAECWAELGRHRAALPCDQPRAPQRSQQWQASRPSHSGEIYCVELRAGDITQSDIHRPSECSRDPLPAERRQIWVKEPTTITTTPTCARKPSFPELQILPRRRRKFPHIKGLPSLSPRGEHSAWLSGAMLGK